MIYVDFGMNKSLLVAEYIEEFIEKLKGIECLSEENVDKIYDEFYKQFNR